MRKKARVVVSVAMGLLAAVLTCWYVTSVREEVQVRQRETIESYGGDVTRVCVAARDIEPGERIDDGSVAVEDWVSSLLPSDAFTSMEEVAGKTATSRIPKRAVVSAAYFIEKPVGSLEVPDGMVAVSVASDEEHALGGAIKAGDRVDVYASRDSVADLLLSAQVLDTSSERVGGAALSWVTLGVEPERVPELLAVTSQGMVTIATGGAFSSGPLQKKEARHEFGMAAVRREIQCARTDGGGRTPVSSRATDAHGVRTGHFRRCPSAIAGGGGGGCLV